MVESKLRSPLIECRGKSNSWDIHITVSIIFFDHLMIMIIIFLLSCMTISTQNYLFMGGRKRMNNKCRTIVCAMLLLVFITAFFQGAQSVYAATLADGTYTVDYVIKKPEDESVSMANDYWEKPATVIVSGGAIKIQTTINHSEWVTQFKVPSGSSYVDAKLISQNKENNTRLVEFSVDSLDSSMLSKIHVTVPEIDYDHDYTIRFVYDTSTLKLTSQPESTATPEPTAKPQTTEPASSGTKEASTSTGKQTETVKESAKPSVTASPTKAPVSSSTNGADGAGSSTAKPSDENVNATDGNNDKGNENQASSAGEQESQTSNEPNNEQAGESVAQESTVAETSEEQADQAAVTNEETVELNTALDGVTTEDATVVEAAGVTSDSNKNNTIVIMVSLLIVLIACVAGVAIYRKRKAKIS